MISKQEIVPDWQSAASSLIVAIGTVYGKIVLDVEPFPPFHSPSPTPHHFYLSFLPKCLIN